ncbi:MAG: RNA polymerase factor sigma-54 [Flavobacteriales bacterium]|nr:RNA polymerase factor sigma-54 [Flavobacteriales bacterium]
MALNQRLQQKQLQRLSPQQIQLMKLLQIPTIALEQRIKEELEINPALEEGPEGDEMDDEFSDLKNDDEQDEYDSNDDDEFTIEDYLQDDDIPDYKLYANNTSADDEERESPLSSGYSFRDLLNEQLGMRVLSEQQRTIAETIIGNLDDDGYLRRELFAIVDDLAFTQNIHTNEDEVEDLLEIIQGFEPAGVGARNLQECLLLQLNVKEDTENIALAKTLIEKMMDEFSKKHYTKICQRLHIEEDQLKKVLDEVLKLNPRPGDSLSDSTKIVQNIVADFMITNEDGKLDLTLNGRNAPQLKVSNEYKQMLRAYSEAKGNANKEQKEAVQFVKQKLDGAKWFIDAILQRQMTLYGTMDAIMEYQKEYFLTGDETKLKPMILKDISDIVGLDISTISRVANSKYVQTQFGTFLLKSFFSESLTTESGEEVSSREVKKILSDAIEGEDKTHPLADEKLAALLKESGYILARRTVAKYREQLGIPVARLRKEL